VRIIFTLQLFVLFVLLRMLWMNYGYIVFTSWCYRSEGFDRARLTSVVCLNRETNCFKAKSLELPSSALATRKASIMFHNDNESLAQTQASIRRRLGVPVRMGAPDLPFPAPSLLPLAPWPLPHELSFPQLLIFVTLVPGLLESATGVAGDVDAIF
jgi:hypothetical protein